MFDVKIMYPAAGKDGHGMFSRELRLPFPPFPGLRVAFINEGDEGVDLVDVAWVVSLSMFICAVESDDDDHAPWKEIRNHYLMDGHALEWERPGRI